MQSVSQNWITAQSENFVPISYVEISYAITDPDLEDKASVISNGEMNFSTTHDLVSTTEKSYFKYAALERNSWILDGTSGILENHGGGSGEVVDTGFVGSRLSSEADATFSENPKITIGFDEIQTNAIPGVTIQWSEAFNQCARSYTITAYSGNVQVAHMSIQGNVSNTVYTEFSGGLSGYDKIEIVILEWCLPLCRPRIEQITLGAIKVFKNGNLLSFEHSQSVDLLSLSLPKSEIVFEVDNSDEAWNPDNPEGIYQYLIERQQAKVKYGYMLSGGIEWIKCGTFYMSGWDTPQNGITATFTARDVLEFMNKPFDKSQITGNVELFQLAVNAYEQSGAPYEEDDIITWALSHFTGENLSETMVALPEDFDYTCGEVLQLCANAARCVMYQDRNGDLYIKDYDPEYIENYVIDRFNSYGNAEYNISPQLKSVNVNDGMGMYTVSGVTSGEEQTISNPLIQNANVANAVAQWIAGILINRRTVSGEFRADPRLDALDMISVVNKYATPKVSITSIKYSYNGAFRGNYEGRVIPSQ